MKLPVKQSNVEHFTASHIKQRLQRSGYAAKQATCV